MPAAAKIKQHNQEQLNYTDKNILLVEDASTVKGNDSRYYGKRRLKMIRKIV